MANCDEALELLQSHYPAFCIYKTIACCVGLITTFYIVKCEGIAWLVHPNAKALFVFHIIFTVLVTLSYLVVYIFEIIRIFTPASNNCDYLFSEKLSFWLRFPAAFACYCQAFAMLAFAIERAISTGIPHAYERKTSPFVGILLGFLSAGIGAILSYALLVVPNVYNGRMAIAASSKTVDNSENYTVWLFSFNITEITTLVIFLGCFVIAKILLKRFKFEKGHKLSTKYQIRENLIIVNTLLPCFTCVTILNILPTGILTVCDQVLSLKAVDRILVMEYANQMPLYALIMPSVMMFRNRQRRRIVKPQAENVQISDHFNNLNLQWR